MLQNVTLLYFFGGLYEKLLSVVLIGLICLCLCSCKKTEAMVNAENAINAIGKVSINSGDLINKAQEAIDALTTEEKEKFKKLDEFEELKKQYNELNDEAEAKKTIELIDSLGEITLESGSKIDEAETSYENLSDNAKQKVTNKSKLDKALNILNELRTAEKERIISEKKPLFNADYDKVEGITWYQHKNMPNYIDIRSYIIPYIGESGNNHWVCIRYNYTADSWIFWENMTIMVDGEKYYKNVGSGNTIRDNDTEVWEWYDECLDYNEDMNNRDLQMLKAIAQSKETIIRFQGDEYHYDLQVTQADKNMIADTLALYEALIW